MIIVSAYREYVGDCELHFELSSPIQYLPHRAYPSHRDHGESDDPACLLALEDKWP